ncbi:MAG: TonB-dependent receptor [Edaphobacter sp.]|uniref:TonB-dependent receptor n=1 Tax=Edaphobacter sp. TaxID=1934404 RepID=UPI00238888B9|nr:TonB-dependent receptor [Edaphobacter sp.]MDE1176026.1 TonB-dependent receptor [Edaphobacter sp.]
MIRHFSHRAGRYLSLAAMLLSLATVTLQAQRYLGSIQGEVKDSTGAVVPNVQVTAEESATHFKSTVTTNNAGAYIFPSLNPGTYSVTATGNGFRSETHTSLILTAGALQQSDFSLQPGTSTEVVNVSAAQTSLLDSGSPNIATTLSAQEVTDLPNVGRNPFVMATMAAGITTGAYAQSKSSQFTNPFSGVSVQVVAAGNSGHNRLTLNGIPDDPAERLSGASYTGFVPSPEAVQEVKVQTSIFDAQVGHGNGTVTNTVIRTGTNKLHGAAYYVFQNTYLNANTYEKVPNQNVATSARTPRNNDQLSQTGFVVDGPVYIPKIYDGRDKTFFMVSFERYASHTAINYSARVPTAAERTGDFSALCTGGFNSAGLCQSGVQIYDPTSPVDANGNRTAYFANNNIAPRISASGAALLAYLPSPNVPGATTFTNPNYISTQTSYPSTYPSFIVRIDHAISSKNTISAILFRSGLTQNYPMQGFPKGIGPTGYGYSVYRNNRGGSIDDVHQFSSSLVLDSRLGVLWHPFGLVYPGNQNFDLSSLGMSSTGLPYVTFPGVSFYSDATNTGSGNSDGYAGLAAGAGGQISTNMTAALAEILTKSIGHHTLRFGFEGNLIRYNVQNPQSGFGAFGFDRRFTQKNSVTTNVGADASSGDAVASMLLGYQTTATYNISAAYALNQVYTAPFVQDDWRFTNKLTLNLGVRWDYESPFTERYNKQVAGFCFTCVNPLQNSVTGLTLNGGLQYTSASNRYPYKQDWNNWQPRLGFAYQALPNTVFRGGFGIIYFNTLENPIGTGFSQTTSYNNYSTSAPLNSLNNAFPTGVQAATGSSLGLSTALGQNISFVDQTHVQPKSVQYSASMQQQLPGSMTLQLAYVGTRPTRLEVNRNINYLPQQYYDQGAANVTYLNAAIANPMAGKFTGTTTLNNATVARNLLLLPYPEFGSVTQSYSSVGSAPYNSLQIQVQRPMKNHFSVQGNLTWSKTMLHTSYLNAFASRLASIQDANATIVANIFGTVELPKFSSMNFVSRTLLGGWQLNSVLRAQNGPLLNAPSNVDIIGNPRQSNPTYGRYFNTCYQNTSGVNVASTASAPACDALSPTPAFRQRLAYTTQHNSTVMNIRARIHPLLDASLFKQFKIHEGTSFEIRGEFFNILNTPNFNSPGSTIGSSTFGQVVLTQANDPRIGQLTARINF